MTDQDATLRNETERPPEVTDATVRYYEQLLFVIQCILYGGIIAYAGFTWTASELSKSLVGTENGVLIVEGGMGAELAPATLLAMFGLMIVVFGPQLVGVAGDSDV